MSIGSTVNRVVLEVSVETSEDRRKRRERERKNQCPSVRKGGEERAAGRVEGRTDIFRHLVTRCTRTRSHRIGKLP